MSLKGLTNFNLEDLAKKYNLPLNEIIMKDKAEEIEKNGFYIINLDDSSGGGTHWTSLYFNNNPLNSLYFDSFGFVPPYEVEEKIKPYIYNDKDIQDYNSKACGYYCLAFIKFINDKTNKEIAFKEFLRMFKNNAKENDDILKKYLNI